MSAPVGVLAAWDRQIKWLTDLVATNPEDERHAAELTEATEARAAMADLVEACKRREAMHEIVCVEYLQRQDGEPVEVKAWFSHKRGELHRAGYMLARSELVGRPGNQHQVETFYLLGLGDEVTAAIARFGGAA